MQEPAQVLRPGDVQATLALLGIARQPEGPDATTVEDRVEDHLAAGVAQQDPLVVDDDLTGQHRGIVAQQPGTSAACRPRLDGCPLGPHPVESPLVVPGHTLITDPHDQVVAVQGAAAPVVGAGPRPGGARVLPERPPDHHQLLVGGDRPHPAVPQGDTVVEQDQRTAPPMPVPEKTLVRQPACSIRATFQATFLPRSPFQA